MAEWYQQPYRTGPKAPVPGFPRSLYPPDAAPDHLPSEDGPDVEAYKRTVWRAQRWQGPPTAFDPAFSKAFAHGKSSNVGDSGVAGVQRQQQIDPPSGFVGPTTFDLLRSLIVPTGPSKGQRAMDANALNLITLAYAMYHGREPTPPVPNTRTVRGKALDGAITHLGDTEKPRDTNRTAYGKWYGLDGQPWCAMFCTYCYETHGGGSPSFARADRYAYVPYIVADARNQRNGLNVTSTPIPGDLVCFDWGYDGTYDHVGMFEAWVPGFITTAFTAIEGNTSTTNNSNGGEVMRRNRRVPDQGTVFVRVREP